MACTECHDDMIPDGTAIEITRYATASYVDAMHGMCVDCHQTRSESGAKAEWADLALCTKCHTDRLPEYWSEKTREILRDTVFNRVVLPVRAREGQGQ